MWYCCTARDIKLSALHTLATMKNLLAECSDLKVKVNFTLKQAMKA